MLAKSFQVLTKFLILVLLVSPVQAGNVFTPLSSTAGVRNDYQPNSGLLSLGLNLMKSLSGQLSSEDQKTHTMTVMFALENIDIGETAVWYNPAEDTAGRIRMMHTQPVQGGYCRSFFTEVRIGKNAREYTETGCKTIDSQFWNFSGR